MHQFIDVANMSRNMARELTPTSKFYNQWQISA